MKLAFTKSLCALDQKIESIEAVISTRDNHCNTQICDINDTLLQKQAATKNTQKKILRLPLIALLIITLSIHIHSRAQTIDDVAIGEILDSMPSGITLRDGTVLKAEVINLGTASPSYAEHGLYNQYSFGGIFNGINDGAATPTGPDGATLAAYSGNKDPLLFTRINANPRGDIDRGDASDYANAIGFHFWVDRPILAKELLLIDCDGSNASENREWFTIFGYNSTTEVNPTVSLSGGTELVSGLLTVDASWDSLVDAEITGSVPSFTQKTIVRNTRATATAFNDPDDLDRQALFDFGTSKVDHLFILWGIRDNLSTAAGNQNSGVSPLVFSFNFDFGDAPNSYRTNKASGGPVHIYPSSGPRLRLGATVTEENNGSPSASANTDTDDGVNTIGLDSARFFRDSLLIDTLRSDFTLTTTYNNPTGSKAYFAAWIDWNNNGVFDTGEGKIDSTIAASTSGSVSFTWDSGVQRIVRASLADNFTYARIRLTTQRLIDTDEAAGAGFQDGEVEDYIIGFAHVPLPLSLISYEAETQADKVYIKWEVADQVDVDRYEIYRSSNGIDFRKIGLAKAVKNQTRYSLWDNDPMNGINLYQLKSVDIDGRFQYAPNTLKVNFNKKHPKLTFYPNPSSRSLSVNSSGYPTLLELKVFNITGQQIMQQSLIKGLNNIDVSSFINGTYYFTLMDGREQISSEKIEISK